MKVTLVAAAVLSLGAAAVSLSDYNSATSASRRPARLAEASGPSPGTRDTAMAEANGASPSTRDSALA